MSTLLLTDASGPGLQEPLRLENDQQNFGFRFLIDDDGNMEIDQTSGELLRLRLAADHHVLLSRTSLGTSQDPALISGATRVLITTITDGVYGLAILNSHPTNPRGMKINFDVQTSGEDNSAVDNYMFGFNQNPSIPTKYFMSSDGGWHNRQSFDTDISDENEKIIEPDPVGSMWAEAKALRIINYRNKTMADTRMLIGLSAQQVGEVMPECLTEATELIDKPVPAHDEVDKETGERRRVPARPERRIPIPAQYYSKDVAFCFYRAVQECMERIEALEA